MSSQVTWFERRTNLEPDFKGCADKEREVVELEETDVNPIGCISGKCTLLRALKYEDVSVGVGRPSYSLPCVENPVCVCCGPGC